MRDNGFLETESVGRFFRYISKVSKKEYSASTFVNVAQSYFAGYFGNVISFLVDENKLSFQDLELLLKQLK